jgi:Uma2 family endonuclease
MRSMRTMQPRLSFADLERMPEDGRRYELYDGELSEVPSPIPHHQRVVMNSWDSEAIEVHVLARRNYQLAHVHRRGETLTSPTLPALTFAAARVFGP